MSSILKIYHGTLEPNLNPIYGGGMEYHDYGKGLYCVEDIEKAKEWACQHENNQTSYVYEYELSLDGLLPPLDLNEYTPAYWLSALASHRYSNKESAILKARRLSFINLFPVDCEQYDYILGWRANDKYFAFLRDFMGVAISYEAIVEAMKLGDLGQQVVLKSERAFTNCKQVNKITLSGDDYTHYFGSYHDNDSKAREKMVELRDTPGSTIEQILARGGL